MLNSVPDIRSAKRAIAIRIFKLVTLLSRGFVNDLLMSSDLAVLSFYD